MLEINRPAVIVLHCAVFGELTRPVRWLRVGDPEPKAQYERAVTIAFKEPRKRSTGFFEIYSNNMRYATILVEGAVVYDSRDSVPCDMLEWQKTFEKMGGGKGATICR